MATVKLTRAIREAIQEAVIKHAYLARCQAHLDAERQFVEDIWNDVVSEDMAQRMRNLPEGWLPMDNDFKAYFDTDAQGLYFATGLGYSMPNGFYKLGVRCPDTESSKRRMPSAWAAGNVVKVYRDMETIDRFRKLQKARKGLETELEDAKRSVMSTLESVTTVKKLIEVWPEIEKFAAPFLEEQKAEARAILPDIPRARLNETLHLPPV